MKTIDRYILASFIRPFIITFFVMVFFLLMQFVWKYVDDLVGKGVEWYYIAELLVYISATVVPLALPLAVLLSSLMTFGSFGEHNELAAMRSSGISLLRLFRPLVFFVLLIAIGGYFFSNHVIPYANFKGQSLLRNITHKKPALNIRPGIFYNGIEGFSIKVAEKFGPDNNELRNVVIYDHSSKLGNIKVTVAETGKMEVTEDQLFLIFTLENGITYEEHFPAKRADREKKPFSSAEFEYSVIRFNLDDFHSDDLRKETRKDFDMLNSKQLLIAADSLQRNLDERIDNFAQSMLEKIGLRSDSIVNDSLILHANILENFSALRQKMAMENALRIARSNRAYFEQVKREFHWRRRSMARHFLEWNKKLSLSFACLVLFFIGAPLGAIIRKGGMGMPVVISVVIFILFHVMSFTFEKLGREMIWYPFPAMWVSSLFFLPFGLILTYKTANDAEFLAMEFWAKRWKWIKGFFAAKGAK